MRAGRRGGELGEEETENVNLKAFEEGNKDIPILLRGRERNDIGRNGTEEEREAADVKAQGRGKVAGEETEEERELRVSRT